MTGQERLRKEQQRKIQRAIDDFYSNRPTERDSLGAALQNAFEALSNTSEIPNSSDPISRQDAITAIIGLPTWYYDSDRHYGDPQPPMEALLDPEDVVNVIENLPPAKQEQKTGWWIMTEKGIHVTDYKCSECGRMVRDDTGYDVATDYPYCHCGAKMEV